MAQCRVGVGEVTVPMMGYADKAQSDVPGQLAIASDQRTIPRRVDSPTKAASIWATVALDVLAAWKLLVVAVVGVLFLLLAGRSIEKWCQKALGIGEKADPPDSR